MPNRVNVFIKDPESILDYVVGWDVWMPLGDTLAASQWIVSPAMDVESSSFTADETTVWLSGGIIGTHETVTNRITTADGRTEDFSFVLIMKAK